MNQTDLFSPRKSLLLSLFLIAIVCLLSYSNTFHVPFQMDDSLNISEKPYVRDIGAFFDPAKIEHYRDDSPFRMRMAAYFTFAVNYRLHGNEVVGYHVVNLAIHLLNGFLVYFLVLLTFRTPYFSSRQSAVSTQRSAVSHHQSPVTSFLALFTALLFVSHPIQTQAVTYIVQRLASLATLFYLLSLVAYIKWRLIKHVGAYLDTPAKFGWRSTVWYLSSLISAVLAMKTKEIAFTLPLVIALYEFLFFDVSLKKRVLYLVPLLLILLIIPFELMGLEKPAGEVIGDVSSATRVQSDISRWDYLFTEFRVIVTYIRLLIFPVDQNLDYDYPVYHSFFDPNVFLSFLFLLALFGAGVYLLYKSRIDRPGNHRGIAPTTHSSILISQHSSRLIAFGIFWFFMTLSVESSIIPITDVIFEHRLYLPSVGFFIAASALLWMAWQRIEGHGKWVRTAALGMCGLIIVVLSVATYGRNAQWKDEVRLWEDVVKKSPSKVRPHSNLGHFYGKQGRLEEAEREYQTALRLDPDDFQVHNNLGVIYKGEGRAEEAIREYRIALRLNPEDAFSYYNLGNIFREQGDYKEAIKHYQTAIRLEPEVEVAVIHNNLGIAYTGLGNLKEAEREFRIAIDLDPGYEAAGRNLEMLLGGRTTGRNPLGSK